MSVGVTVHDVVDLPSPMGSNPLADLENVRKIANEKLRIRRLVQVRQQSKQLAAKVRQNYQQAKEKELAKIEQTKREELKAWKRQHIRTLQDEYARNVCEVGEAHRAAEAAEECAVWFEEKRATQQAVALQRGKAAEANAARERDRKEAQKEAKLRKKQYVPSKSIAVQASIPAVEPPPAEVADEARKDVITIDGGSSTEPTSSPYEHFRSSRNRMNLHTMAPETILSDSDDEQYCPGKENVPAPVGHEYSATAFTSPSDFRPNVVSPPSLPKPQRLQPFTQITELIQQRRRQRQQHSVHDDSRHPAGAYREPYGTQKTVQFDDMSDNTLSFPTSSVLTSDDRPFVPDGANESPRKVPPRKMAENPKTVPAAHPEKVTKMNTFKHDGRRMKVVATEPSSSSTVSYADGACSTKVQYYDCNTRFRKEYDQPVGFVQREQYRSDDPTAMEEANRYEQLQQELAKARSKPIVDRTKPALEKQQTRKDYEKLSKELDNLTRTENKLKSLAVPSKSLPSEATFKQQAVTRQRKANEAIENLLRQRSLVTCPIVQMQSEQHPNPTAVRPSVVNVAEMKTKQQHHLPEGKDMSTDSCASIVLDTFERPGIPLPPSAAISGGIDKIAKLKELLDQINEQRRLLTEEIAREKAEQATKPTSSDANAATRLEIERLERMKRRQEELLEQQQLLQKREREVEDLSRQLEEKMAVLHRKQQKQQKGMKKPSKAKVQVDTKGQQRTIDVDVVEPSSVASSISETSKNSYESVEKQSDNTQPPPVKIIITVNDKGTRAEKSKRKKKDTQEKKRSENVVQQPKETVATNEPMQTEIIKPLASRKEAQKKKVIDFSPGSSSTTSTVYRPLPPKIGSLKILQREVPGAASEPSKSIAPEVVSKGTSGQKYNLQKSDKGGKVDLPTGATNLNPNLLKYIVRLLGMSRQSIDQLGVSTTSVSTPNASVVNVSSNNIGGAGQRPPQPGSLAPNEEEGERINRLRKFIDENYNFLQEIDETLRRSSSEQSTLGSSSERSGLPVDAEVSRVEGIWMETLRRRERTMKKQQRNVPEGIEDRQRSKDDKTSKKQDDKTPSVQPNEPTAAGTVEPAPQPTVQTTAPTVKEGSLKSILKSPKRDTSAKVAKIITPQGHVEVINLSDREEQEILERYSQLTERCHERITELSQMINQVREEKRRLIEDSLSSLEQQESTKYMDLPPAINRAAAIPATQQPNVVVAPSSSPAASPLQAAGNPSAPSTVVPAPIGDDPVSEEIDNIFSSKQIGLSKDSGIAMSRPLTASDIRESPSEEGSQGREPLPFEPFLKDIPKPPFVSSTGVGAQGEVGGGPGTKAVQRRSTPPVAIARFSPQLPDELPMHELSTIPEVETPAPAVATSKGNDLSAVSVTAGDNSNTAEVLAEARNRLLLNEPSIPGYDRFPNYDEYVRSTTTGTGTASFARVELEQTVERNDRSILAGLDVTEDREPDRLAYRKYPAPAPAFDITEEGEATPQHSTAASSTVAGAVNKSGSDASLPDVVAELRKRNIIVKPFNNSLDNSNRSTPLSDTQQEDGNPTKLQPLSDSFLRWASSMLKRSSQLEQHSSGSSPNSLGREVIGPNDETVANDSDRGLGKPPNLAEFIARELMVRTQSDLQSNTSLSSSSHGSHSTLLRSLLNFSRQDNSNSNTSPLRDLLMHTPTDGKSIQRTSTPVAASKSTASGNSLRMGGNGNTDPTVSNNRTETEGLFSGESRLSSVHWSSSSGNSSDRQEPPQQQRLTVPDVRLERQSNGSNRDRK